MVSLRKLPVKQEKNKTYSVCNIDGDKHFISEWKIDVVRKSRHHTQNYIRHILIYIDCSCSCVGGSPIPSYSIVLIFALSLSPFPSFYFISVLFILVHKKTFSALDPVRVSLASRAALLVWMHKYILDQAINRAFYITTVKIALHVALVHNEWAKFSLFVF